MIDVEVTSLTQKSRLHGIGRSIHLAKGPLSAHVIVWRGGWGVVAAGGTVHTWKSTGGPTTEMNCGLEQDA